MRNHQAVLSARPRASHEARRRSLPRRNPTPVLLVLSEGCVGGQNVTPASGARLTKLTACFERLRPEPARMPALDLNTLPVAAPIHEPSGRAQTRAVANSGTFGFEPRSL